MTFAKQLKKAMEQVGISQIKLSQSTGLAKSSISQYLSGKVIPKTSTIELIEEVLEMKLEDVSIEGEAIVESFKNVPVKEAAKRIGMSQQFVRGGLIQGTLPIGAAVKLSSKWTYHISPKLLDDYIGKEA